MPRRPPLQIFPFLFSFPRFAVSFAYPPDAIWGAPRGIEVGEQIVSILSCLMRPQLSAAFPVSQRVRGKQRRDKKAETGS